jgi:hypothetical protein
VQDEEREIEKGMSEGWTGGDVVRKKKMERGEDRREKLYKKMEAKRAPT